MNGLGWALVWSAVPVTLMASVALILERLASRRGPVSGAWVSGASLLVIVVLTPLAICGLPQRWCWRIPSLIAPAERVLPTGSESSRKTSIVSVSASAPSRSIDQESAGGGFGWTRAWWHRLRGGADRELNLIGGGTSILQAAWGAFVLTGSTWFLGRLLLGLWGVRDCRRRSRLIVDPDVVAEVESFRLALSIAACVEVRELEWLTGSTAAAVGWLRPVVLFPCDWRCWSGLERRAVLAHEMAHIGRADYLSGIVAQLGLAVHFYHPLVHWLVSRLRLQQELAADALGAPLAGGRTRYLRALSRMALRPDENPLAWPARTFLPAGSNLIRRIQMLKEKVQGQDRSLSVAGCVVTMTLLVAAGTAAVAFRGVAPARAAETPAVTSAMTESIVGRFDLSYMPPDAVGVWAIRPAAISRLPGLKSHVDQLSEMVAKEFQIGLPKLGSIEQVAVEFSVRPRDRSKKQPGRLITGDWMIRSVEDHDWRMSVEKLWKIFAERVPKRDLTQPVLDEVRFNEQVYYKGKFAGFVHCFYFPDARTVVCSFHEERLRERIKRGAGERPEFLHGDDWRQVDRGLFAVAIDNREERWKLDVAKEDPEDLAIAPLLRQASRWVAGVDASDVVKVHAIATCPGAPQGETVARIAQERMAMAKVAMAGRVQAGSPKKPDEEKTFYQAAKDLMEACQIRRQGAVVEFSAERKVEPDALAAFFLELAPF